MIRPALLCAALVAPPALADCPTAADLDAGLIALPAPPMAPVTLVREGGMLVQDDLAAPGGAARVLRVHPLLVAETGPPGARTRYSYAADLAPLDRLDEEGLWSSAIVAVSPRAGTLSGRTRIRYLGATQARVGDCTYPAWQLSVETRFGWLGWLGGPEMRLTYSPGLGLVTAAEALGAEAQLFPPLRLTAVKRR